MTGRRGSAPYLGKRTLPLAAFLFVVAAAGAVLVLSGTSSAVSLHRNTDTLDADVFVSGSLGDQFPSAMSAGDWNNDGYGDVAMCSQVNNTCGIWLGRPLTTNAGTRMDAPNVAIVGPGGQFGFSAAFVGDVNGDGYDDLLIGAPALVGREGERMAGSAWLFLGRTLDVNGRSTLAFYQANTHIIGAQANATLGSAAVAAGDLDKDGHDDFWVIAGRLADPGGPGGSAYLFPGRSVWPADTDVSGAILTIDNITSSKTPRPSLLGGVDLDGDGRLDFAIGSDRYANLAGDEVGAVFVFLNPYGRVGQVLGPAQADVAIRGTLNISSMGSSIAFARNFVIGAVPSLFVAADFNTTNASAGGAVYIFRTSGWTCCRVLYGWDAHGLLYSPDENDLGGYSLATGDFDGDGLSDLAVGAYYAGAYDLVAPGVVYLFYGREVGTTPVQVRNATGWINGAHDYCLLGQSLVTTDFNNDGKSDFFAGCPLSEGFEFSSGDMFGFFGRPRNRAPVVSITGPPSAVEGENVTISVSIQDADADHLRWGFGFGQGDLHNEYTNLPKFNYTVRDEGDVVWEVEVTDGEFVVTASHRFVATNANPRCSFEVDVPFDEGKNRSVRVVGFDPGPADRDELVYYWSGPTNMTVNGTTAWYRPPRGQPFTVRVEIRDQDGGVGTCAYAVPVRNGEPMIEVSAPSEVTEGSTVALYAAVYDNGTEDVVTVTWRTPDGLTIQGGIVNWVPMHPGVVVFNVSAADLDGAVVYRNVTVRVRAVAPDVVITIPANATEGSRVTLTVTQRTGDFFDPITVNWHVCNHPLGSGLTYTLLRADPGNFCVEALVIDDDGQWVQLTGWLQVENRPPLAGVEVTPSDVISEGTLVGFQVVLADHETAELTRINVTWRVDDRIVGYGPQFYWRAIAGEHTVEALARDPGGAQSRVSYPFNVFNLPPTVYIIGASSVAPGAVTEWLAFAGDPSGAPVSIEWQVDGAVVAHGDVLQWGSTTRGPHRLTAVASDGFGAESTATFDVMVEGTGEVVGIDFGFVPYVLTAAVAFSVGMYAGRIFQPGARSEQGDHRLDRRRR